MAHFFHERASALAGAPALVDPYRTVEWNTLNERTNRLIGAFRAAGLAAGDTFAIFAGNCCEYYELMAAASHAGLIYVPVNWHFTAEELAYVLQDADCKMLFVEAPFVQVAVEADREFGAALPIVAIRAAEEGFADFEAWLANGTAEEPDEQALGGPMFYTSGTTGRPKGVRSSTFTPDTPLEAMGMMGAGLSGMLGIPADGTTLICGPVYHSAQWAFSFLPLLAGSTVVMRDKFDAAETLAVIDEHAVTNVHLVPTQFRRLLRLDEDVRAEFAGTSLAAVWHGAAPCPPEVKRQMIAWWGNVVHEYYGSTEGSIVTTIRADEWLAKPGSVGKASPMVEVRIIQDDGTAAPVGEPGQIYVKNLMGADFEYHNEPEKTAEVHLEPGLFTFGDIGYFDADDYLFLSDRKIDMIISGGVNIYPAEIEGVLAAHDAVHDAAVFGIPNEEFGEEVKAAIELVPGVEATAALEADLDAHCRQHLAGFKAPRSYDYVDVLPRHDTGKLYKRLLRDPYWQDSGRSI